VTLAKYIPHEFTWRIFDLEETITEKKKKQTLTFKAKDADLRKYPFLLKDGDVIGVCIGGDDMQTEEDEQKKVLFAAEKEQKQKERDA